MKRSQLVQIIKEELSNKVKTKNTLKESLDSAIEKLVKHDDASEMIALIKGLPDAARRKLAKMFKIELQEEGDPVRGNKILDRGNPNVSLEKDYYVTFYVGDNDYDWDVKAASPEDAIKKVQSGQVEGPYGQALPRGARKFHAQLK
jgi:hypothetical protein